MRPNYTILLGFFRCSFLGGFGGWLFGCWFLVEGFHNFGSGFFPGNAIFYVLGTIVNAIDEATNTDDEHVCTEEADEGGDFEVASINDDEAHDGATDAEDGTDEAIGWVDGRNDAVDEINNAGNCGVD